MSHSYKRSKSKFEQFRMAVPADIRPIVGRTAWAESLRTTDPLHARELRAHLVQKYAAEIRRIREGERHRAERDAVAMLQRASTRLADRRGSMDIAIEQQLGLLASFVCDSWIETAPIDR